MVLSNRDRIERAMLALGDGLSGFVDTRMSAAAPNGADWVQMLAERDEAKHGAAKKYSKTDAQFLLKVLTEEWKVFAKDLSRPEQAFATELRDSRNKWAHAEAFTYDDTYRTLDTAERLLTVVGAVAQAETMRDLRLDLQRQEYEKQTKKRAATASDGVSVEGVGLRPWREVVRPHDDVARGEFNASEYAADLWMVSHGQGAAEYIDPVEFFRRTYLTETLRVLLRDAVNRVSGDGNAAPVFNLQTNFGGGKTHTLLALWHAFSGRPAADFPQEVQELLAETNYKDLGEVRRVVLVGTHLSPSLPIVKEDGTEVRTLWGELAWQLGGRAAYDRIAQADGDATSPGEALISLINDYSPCVILVDEWVAYARQLVGRDDLAGGTFDVQFSFAQLLTEAAKSVPGVLLCVSIPASSHADDDQFSALEVGGENGREALKKLQNVVRRQAEPRAPATSDESFEIVKRRLFEAPDGAALAEIAAVARQYWQFYVDRKGELPGFAGEMDYERRIRDCYPLHPELFDRLYQDWSTLERFQRTRGVLRMMSRVVNELWMRQDPAPMIMPGTLPLDNAELSAEITQYLEDTWKPIIDTDVDGPNSTPVRIDSEKKHYGQRAMTRRLARSVFMGSAATLRTAHKGIDRQRILLGAAIPGDNVGNFASALHLLGDRATYLYADGDRYWYDTQPSVTRMARDMADRLAEKPEEAWAEIIRRLRSGEQAGKRGDFVAVHGAPDSSAEVPDGEEARLVVLHPQFAHRKGKDDSPAMTWARDCLDKRGASQRVNRNTLIFCAPDETRLEELTAAALEFLAWKDIGGRVDELNLAPQQAQQARNRRDEADKAVDLRIAETYIHLLYPEQPDGAAPITWGSLKADGEGSLAQRACKKLLQSDLLRTIQAPSNIRVDLDTRLDTIWSKGWITVGELWGLYTRYPYLARLKNRAVLDAGVLDTLGLLTYEADGFAIADSYDSDAARFVGLQLPSGDARSIQVTDKTVLARIDVAEAQLAKEKPPEPVADPVIVDPDVPPVPTPQVNKGPTRFHGVVPVNPERYGAAFNKIGQEVLAHLVNADGVEVHITLEVSARAADGFSEDKVRVVVENAHTLKFTQSEFSD